MENPTLFSEFMERMIDAFPDATVEEDLEGQMVIYTNLRAVMGQTEPYGMSIPAGELHVIPFEPEDS